MSKYLFFIFMVFVLSLLGDVTRYKGFNKLKIRRELNTSEVIEGEELKITTYVENNKWLPISYLVVEEKMPANLPRIKEEGSVIDGGANIHYTNRYSILWFQRIKTMYKIKALNRGTYLIKNINVAIGDAFGFGYNYTELEDFLEILVYPKLIDTNKLSFNCTNLQGDAIIRRWIYQDPLYIKGIREYNREDRMKDIHWKSSLKMNKLMVKECDFTSEKEVVFIINNQFGEILFETIDKKAVEEAIRLAASLAAKALDEGAAAGMWTNAYILSYEGNNKQEVQPSLNSYKSIMELCARMDYTAKIEFYKFIKERINKFDLNTTYIIIASYLDEESINVISRLKQSGVLFKVIDMSEDEQVPFINGIEKISYRGDRDELD